MEPPQIPSDDDIQNAAEAFADIIFGNPKLSKFEGMKSTFIEEMKSTFIDDFSHGAKWMRRKMRKAYEDIPIPQGREGEPKASQTT